MALPNFTHDMEIIRKLDDYPNDTDGLTADELKARFDEGGEALADYLNDVLIPAILAGNIPFTSSDNIPKSNVQAAIEAVYAAIQDAAVGQLPNKTVTMAKLAGDVTDFLNERKTADETFSQNVEEITTALEETDAEVATKQPKLVGTDGQIVSFDSEGNVVSRFTVDSIDAVSGNMANLLLSEAHAGRDTTFKQDVLLGLFQNKSAVESVSQLNVYDGAFVGIRQGLVNVTITGSSSYTTVKINGTAMGNGTYAVQTGTSVECIVSAENGTHGSVTVNGEEVRNSAGTYTFVLQGDGTIQRNTKSTGDSNNLSYGAIIVTGCTGLVFNQNFNDGGNSYPRKTIVAASGVTTIATLTTFNFRTTSSLKIKYTYGGTSVKFGLYQGGTLLGETAVTAISSQSGKTELTLTLTGTINPNEPCELRATSTGSGLGLYIWEMSLASTEVTYTSGSVVTKPEAFKAKRTILYIRWSGTKPTVSYSVGDGEFTMIPIGDGTDCTTYGGTACKRSTATVAMPTTQRSGNIRFKFELSGAGSAVYDYCVALMQQ